MKFNEKYTDNSYIIFSDNRSKIPLSENKVKYIGINNNKQIITAYIIDGGVLTGHESAKCDYALFCHDSEYVYFIELKGSDFIHACEQIKATIKQLLIIPSIKSKHVFARIVLSKVRTPMIRSSQETALRNVLKEINRIDRKDDFKYKSREFEEIIT